jgi:flagellar motor switch protein FliN
MTETATSLELSRFLEVWAESIAQVLGQIRAAPFACTVLAEAPPVPAADNDQWIVCACAGGLRGEMTFRLPVSSVFRLAQIFMSEPAASDEQLTAQHSEAAIELLRQIAGVVATALKPIWGEVQLRLEPSASAPSWSASATTWLRAGDDPTDAALVEVQLSAALTATLRGEKTGTVNPTSADASSSQQNSPEKLGLLRDVELALTLRFGSRSLLLRQVLELNPGSVVELDRRVEEPVDVLLDGRIVARGEVVVLNGNYGLRVTEVASPAAGRRLERS